MAGQCSACGASLEGAEKFCGSCGKPVQESVAASPASADHKPAQPNPNPQSGFRSAAAPSPSARQGRPLLVPALVIGVLLAGGAYYFLSQPSGTSGLAIPSNTPPAVVSPPPRMVEGEAKGTPEAVQPAEIVAPIATSALIETAIARTAQAYTDAGITSVAPHRLDVASCADCAPFQIYCAAPITDLADLKGRKVRVVSRQTEIDLITSAGGSPTPLGFSEVAGALKTGIIECSMSGGAMPQP